jgi:ubiquinone/menaquinone biosynthesis C-methylase UbiE
MNTEKKDFNSEAASWDQNPGRVKLAGDVAGAIVRQVALTQEMDVLDFGCGTGLLTLHLQPRVRSITGADSSEGMLDGLRQKISSQAIANVAIRHCDLDAGDTLSGSYHLVVSSMTLHHVRDTQALIEQFYAVTAPSGYLCIADLDPDGGRFHAENTGVFHFGFDRKSIHEQFSAAGYTDVRDVTAAEMVKPVPGGGSMKFSVFLVIGTKPR